MKDGKLDKWESLIVRVCKSKRPKLANLNRIIGWRNALHHDHVDPGLVLEILLDMLTALRLADLRSFVPMAHPSRRHLYGLESGGITDSSTATAIAAAVSVLRHAPVSALPGFAVPGRLDLFRGRDLPSPHGKEPMG